MSVRNLIVGADLSPDEPLFCYYDRETGITQTAPMRKGNDPVSFAGVLDMLEREDLTSEELGRVQEEAAGQMLDALDTLGIQEPERQISGMVITVPHMTPAAVRMARYLYAVLGLPESRTGVQDYRESFYYHTLYQKEELWSRSVGFFWFRGGSVMAAVMHLNRRTKPVTVTVQEGKTIELPEGDDEKDAAFLGLAEDTLADDMYSSVFLMGEGFDRSWAARSVPFLCRGQRKVFMVDGIFARGACYAAREKITEKKLGGYLYMGDDLVRYNVGMEMIADGSKRYCPLISAGVNWYETATEFECMLQGEPDEPQLVFTVSGMEDGRRRYFSMQLDDMPKRPPKTTRLRVRLGFTSPEVCRIAVEDMGLGEIFPTSGKSWTEEINAAE